MSTIIDRQLFDPLQPLTKRTRSDAVIAELADMRHLPRAAILGRAAATDRTRRLRLESLVALVRAFELASDGAAADVVMEALIRRLSGMIHAKVTGWATLSLSHQEDAKREALVAICDAVYNCTARAEFWECNFTTSFQRCMSNLLSHLTAKSILTVSLTLRNDEGQEDDGLANVNDPLAGGAFTEVEMREMISALSCKDPRIGRAIYLRAEGMTDKEIAASLGVTDRTIRNWMTEVRKLWE